MIATKTAIEYGRSLLETPYSKFDCINYIKKIIRACAGGDRNYQVAGTNSLWKSKDLTWKQESLEGARAGMLAFKVSGDDVHHVGLVTGDGTVLHSSSAFGKVVETNLYNGQWSYLAMHKMIQVPDEEMTALEEAIATTEPVARAEVVTASGKLNLRQSPSKRGKILAKIAKGTVVDVIDNSADDWWLVSYDGYSGYVFTDYLHVINPDEEGTTVATTTTLLCDDGRMICLLGAWRVAED